ncbi:uncharacterized protein [Primulina huaijiensis]|uniref:uncharacterized protein n=1 Tax=Primulina huaijiensis TaxID=1492673 RepID=UPI003CC7986A
MWEIWKEIRILRQQVGSRAPVPKRGSPFSLAILKEGLPPNFRQSNVGEYDGYTDPEEHLGRFENAALLHQYSDGVSSKRHQKNYLSMFVMKQQEAETLREFVQRFNSAALEISTTIPDIMISAFTQRLTGGEFIKSLVKKPPSSYDDLLGRTEKYVNLEDAQRYRRMENRPGGSRVEGAESGSKKRGAGIEKSYGGEGVKGKGGEVVEGGEQCSASATGQTRRILVRKGADLPQDPVIGFGPEDLRDVVAPHNDALVVTATIANYDVARIFIDNGSSMNILFKNTLDQMKVEGFEFEPIITPLYGFAGYVIPQQGRIVLPLSLGHEPRRVTNMTTFTVVDTPSAYNGILGRPALKDFRAVASTYHQKLKFPVGKRVGVLCGDQNVARRCYEGIVKEERKRTRVEVSMIRRGRSGLPVVRKEVREVMEEEPEVIAKKNRKTHVKKKQRKIKTKKSHTRPC